MLKPATRRLLTTRDRMKVLVNDRSILALTTTTITSPLASRAPTTTSAYSDVSRASISGDKGGGRNSSAGEKTYQRQHCDRLVAAAVGLWHEHGVLLLLLSLLFHEVQLLLFHEVE